MKCGSCRDANADTYKKINVDDNLFEILKTLNSHRAYNPKYSYFCDECIKLATAKLNKKVTTNDFSDQHGNSFTAINESTASSKDEYDEMVASRIVFSDKGTPLTIPPNRNKRQADSSDATRKSKPCPKRFKKPLVPSQLENIAEDEPAQPKSKPTSQVNPVQETSSEQRSTESISETDMMFDLIDEVSSSQRSHSSGKVPESTTTSSRRRRSSSSLSSEGSSNKHTTIRSGSQHSKDVIDPPEIASPNISTTSVRIQQKDRTINTPSTALPGTSTASERTQPTDETINLPQITNPKSSTASARKQPKDRTNNPGTSTASVSKQPTDETANPPPRPSTTNPPPRPGTTNPPPRPATTNPPPRPGTTNPPKRPGTTTSSVRTQPTDSPRPGTSTAPVRTQPTDQRINPPRDTISGPLAPIVKNPRIRQPNTSIPRSVQDYFATTTTAFDVNNYSRTLAG